MALGSVSRAQVLGMYACSSHSREIEIIALGGSRLELRLYQLTAMEQDKVKGDYDSVIADIKDLMDILAREGDVRGVLVQASETSTGVKHPVKEIAAIEPTGLDVVFECAGLQETIDKLTEDLSLEKQKVASIEQLAKSQEAELSQKVSAGENGIAELEEQLKRVSG